jgi:hypothetical protein
VTNECGNILIKVLLQGKPQGDLQNTVQECKEICATKGYMIGSINVGPKEGGNQRKELSELIDFRMDIHSARY